MAKGWKLARALLANNFCVPGASADLRQRKLDPAPPDDESIQTDPDAASSIRVKGTCSICLELMQSGAGRALFTAECTHMFHFSCIASSVKHGNMICPICRAKWFDVPWKRDQQQARRVSRRRYIAAPAPQLNLEPVLQIVNDSIANAQRFRRTQPWPQQQQAELELYNDDEECVATLGEALTVEGAQAGVRVPKLSAIGEAPAVAASESREQFTILVNIKAPAAASMTSGEGSSSRAPIDLVTVLDVSGSMAGSKIALLKSAMEFVIGQLSDHDRLSIVSFSTSATRVLSLKRMGSEGKAMALQAVMALAACGGTNIGDGLRTATKVLHDRQWKNPVSSIMLLSDGQDTTGGSHLVSRTRSQRRQHPVYAFGFGSDHDASMLHGIADSSGGTFSFIRAESSVQDAFAQCIGGLLSVVSQGLELSVSSSCGGGLKIVDHGFQSRVSEDGTAVVVELGDLYAEEERDILLELTLGRSPSPSEDGMGIAKVSCKYRDSLSPGLFQEAEPCILSISRPTSVQPDGKSSVSILVDRQRNRVMASEAIDRSRAQADAGDLIAAQACLVECRSRIESSAAFAAGDALSKSLQAELKELQTRMENRRLYEETGRAFALSAYSSHCRQRATMRDGDVDGNISSSMYQTSSMADMVHLSQTFASRSSSKDGVPPSSSSSRRSKSSRRVNPAHP